MSSHELSWALMSDCGHSITLMGTQEHWKSLKSTVPWCHERSWVLIRAHAKVAKCSLELMRTQECPLVLMNAQLFNSTINKKCALLKWPPCSILPISQFRFDQIIKTWTFSNSTRKRLLENVQDFYPSPKGSREIAKNKVVTVLLDTL